MTDSEVNELLDKFEKLGKASFSTHFYSHDEEQRRAAEAEASSFRDRAETMKAWALSLGREASSRGVDPDPFALVADRWFRFTDIEVGLAIKQLRVRLHIGNGEVGDSTDWSQPNSKKKLASLLGCPVTKKVEWLNRCVKDGTHRIRKCTRQTWQLDLANVPENLRDKFRDNKSH